MGNLRTCVASICMCIMFFILNYGGIVTPTFVFIVCKCVCVCMQIVHKNTVYQQHVNCLLECHKSISKTGRVSGWPYSGLQLVAVQYYKSVILLDSLAV